MGMVFHITKSSAPKVGAMALGKLCHQVPQGSRHQGDVLKAVQIRTKPNRATAAHKIFHWPYVSVTAEPWQKTKAA
ncbi:MAG: hypothetical protein K2Q11_07490 [Burkholderiaceae bacterium]|nr:hypothetical protein [Burkholderiaceae bacterium]